MSASVVNRRLSVSWSAVAGASSYKVQTILKTRVASMTWREYSTTATSYTVSDRWALSGQTYEVRVAAVNGSGQSAWSSIATAIGVEGQSVLTQYLEADLHGV